MYNLNKNTWKKRGVIAFSASYIAIILISFIITMLMYMNTQKILREEIIRANSVSLHHLKLLVDNNLEEVENLYNELTYNVKLQNILDYRGDIWDSYYRYDISTIAKQFGEYNSKYRHIEDFYLVLHKSGDVIVPNSRRSEELNYKLLHEGTSLNFNAWQTLVRQPHNFNTIQMSVKNTAGNIHDKIALLSSIGGDSKGNPAATLVTILSTEKIFDFVDNVDAIKGEEIIVLDRDSNKIISTKNSTFNFDFRSLDDLDEGITFKNVDKNKYAISYIKSGKFNWKYVNIISFALFLKPILDLRTLAIVFMVVGTFLGIIVMLYGVKRNYTPVVAIVESISKTVGVEYRGVANEFKLIKDAIGRITEEKAKLATTVDIQNEKLRDVFLAKLIKGKFDYEISLEDAFEIYRLPFATDCYAIIILDADEISSLVQSEYYDYDRVMKSMSVVLENMIKVSCEGTNPGVVFEVDNSIIYIVNLEEEESEKQKIHLVSIAELISKAVTKEFGIDTKISISNVEKGLENISKCYRQALDASEYRLIIGGQNIITYDEMSKHDETQDGSGYYFPIHIEQQLIYSIQSNAVEKSKKLIDEIFEVNFGETPLRIDLAKLFIYDLTGAMFKAVSGFGSNITDSIQIDILNRISNFQTIDEIQSEVHEIADQISAYISTQRRLNKTKEVDERNRQIAQEVKEYVMENYADFNLNLSSLSAGQNISASHLSKIFKQCFNIGMLEYINSYRVNIAKEYLEKENWNVNEVYSKVGFSDINTFIRAFKKYEGITPGKYKELQN